VCRQRRQDSFLSERTLPTAICSHAQCNFDINQNLLIIRIVDMLMLGHNLIKTNILSKHIHAVVEAADELKRLMIVSQMGA